MQIGPWGKGGEKKKMAQLSVGGGCRGYGRCDKTKRSNAGTGRNWQTNLSGTGKGGGEASCFTDVSVSLALRKGREKGYELFYRCQCIALPVGPFREAVLYVHGISVDTITHFSPPLSVHLRPRQLAPLKTRTGFHSRCL